MRDARSARHGVGGSSARDYFYKRYVRSNRELQSLLDEERVNAAIAQTLYDLRVKAGLSQRALAERLGTTASVVCRLEDSDYEGHSLKMLIRVLFALGQGLELMTFDLKGPKSARTKIAAVPVMRRAKLRHDSTPVMARSSR
jgi:transcriptional regulator with XRE-family HTH domain